MRSSRSSSERGWLTLTATRAAPTRGSHSSRHPRVVGEDGAQPRRVDEPDSLVRREGGKFHVDHRHPLFVRRVPPLRDELGQPGQRDPERFPRKAVDGDPLPLPIPDPGDHGRRRQDVDRHDGAADQPVEERALPRLELPENGHVHHTAATQEFLARRKLRRERLHAELPADRLHATDGAAQNVLRVDPGHFPSCFRVKKNPTHGCRVGVIGLGVLEAVHGELHRRVTHTSYHSRPADGKPAEDPAAPRIRAIASRGGPRGRR